MMKNSEILYYLALQSAIGVGDINAKKLIAYCGSAQAVLEEKPINLEKIPGIGTRTIKGIKSKTLLKNAEKELIFINNNNIEVFVFSDKNFPEKLKYAIDAPILLFHKGKIDLINQRIISIVGTRMITNYGKTFLTDFFDEIKNYNPIIVSGLAYGIDIYAHQLAIKNKLQTIGVLAHGLDNIYPKKHKREAEMMCENGGLFTEFWSNTIPDKENFVKRNRIVAGISEATIVIESAEKGGSLITAGIANSYNRDVFAVPGRTSDKYSRGCNQLIKTNQAALINSAKDLVYMLNWDLEKKSLNNSIQKQMFVELQEHEEVVYKFLIQKGKQTLDSIALNCNYPIRKTASLLLNLELKGVVKPLPGKFYESV